MNQGRKFGKGVLFAAIGAGILLGLAAIRMNAAPSNAQFNRREWEKAAGGKMSFAVASVKKSTALSPGPGGYQSNFPLTLGSNFGSVGNLMSVNVPLRALIAFGFKLSAGQTQYLIFGLPDWVNSEWFDVEARAPIPSPTKDQFRLMVQVLLADRFKMATHDETRNRPLYALELVKPGKTGPRLRRHVDDATCGAESRTDAPPPPAELASLPCGYTIMGGTEESVRLRGGGRNVSLDYIAAFLTGTGFQETTPDRPVVNRTGLNGTYDFSIEFVPETDALADGTQPGANGLSFPEALHDQLGLKLTAKTGPIDVIVVDHIEEPTAN